MTQIDKANDPHLTPEQKAQLLARQYELANGGSVELLIHLGATELNQVKTEKRVQETTPLLGLDWDQMLDLLEQRRQAVDGQTIIILDKPEVQETALEDPKPPIMLTGVVGRAPESSQEPAGVNANVNNTSSVDDSNLTTNTSVAIRRSGRKRSNKKLKAS